MITLIFFNPKVNIKKCKNEHRNVLILFIAIVVTTYHKYNHSPQLRGVVRIILHQLCNDDCIQV